MAFTNNRYHGCIAFVVLFFVLTSCGPKVFSPISPGKDSFTMNIEFSPAIPEVLQNEITNEFNRFCAYSASHPVKFIDAKGDPNADITLKVHDFKYVTKGQSAAGIAVSLIGFTTPVLLATSEAPIIFTFWYFPKSISIAEMTMRNNAYNEAPRMYRLGGPGFLMSAAKQETRHAKAYRDFFATMASFYEKEFKKSLTRR